MITQSKFATPDLGILGSDKAIATLEKTLEYAKQTGDKRIISSTLDYLAHHLHYRATSTEDLSESDTLAKRWQLLTTESNQTFSPISTGIPRRSTTMVISPYAEHYWHTAQSETLNANKLALLELALKEVPNEIADSEKSGMPEAIATASHVASKVFASIAKIEEDPSRKRALLGRALSYRNKSKTLNHKLSSFSNLWNRGLDENYLADIEAEHLTLVQTATAKTRILSKAIRLKEACLRLCCGDMIVLNWASEGPSPYWGFLGKYQLECGDMYVTLYELELNPEHLRRASERFTTAAYSFEKVNQRIHVAFAHWKAGVALEKVNDHVRASESYSLASNGYDLAAQKTPSLKEFYEQLSFHMRARSEIEKARDNHSHGDNAGAEECYHRAAILQKSSGKWSYLSPSISALAQLETAEDKSSREQSEDASAAFITAARKFHESRIAIEAHTVDLDGPEVKREAEAFTRNFEARELYCMARADLEEARILNMKGQHRASSEKYRRAVETLQRIAQRLQSGPDRVEADLTVTMSKAWQTMARAEAETSPELYEAASKLFQKAKDSSPSNVAKTLFMGHSRFCSSLQAASIFLDQGRVSDYQLAMQRLESASACYTTAGFHSASEHAKATKRLLEAHTYLSTANTERNQEKKVQIYSAAERLLKASADSFAESGQVAKKEHITRLLDKVREERELAISLSAALATSFGMPSVVFPSSTSQTEEVVGVGKLQGAFVVANVFSSPTNLRLGELVNLKIELANAGMNTAQLVKVERIVPEGFDLVEKPKELLLEERHLILTGQRLEPSKSEELSLVIKPKVEGSLAINPRVLYLDENGKGRVHEPDPIEILVGTNETFDQIPQARAEDIFQHSPMMKFLADAFVEDYMRRRLSLEHAGWRGLLEIVRSLKIPRSRVYGDARYKHAFGKPLQKLVKRGIVEFRVFPGSRGRGGNIVKVRISYEKEPVKRIVDGLTLKIPS